MANVEHLMLRADVAEAVERGELHIYPVETVDDAMEILTGMPAGKPDANGESPEGTLNYLVEQQLVGFAVVAKRFGDLLEVEKPKHGRGRKKSSKRSNRRGNAPSGRFRTRR